MLQTYQYTKDIVTDQLGALRANSWQATPGTYLHTSRYCLEVLGTDVPAEVQAKLILGLNLTQLQHK